MQLPVMSSTLCSNDELDADFWCCPPGELPCQEGGALCIATMSKDADFWCCPPGELPCQEGGALCIATMSRMQISCAVHQVSCPAKKVVMTTEYTSFPVMWEEPRPQLSASATAVAASCERVTRIAASCWEEFLAAGKSRVHNFLLQRRLLLQINKEAVLLLLQQQQ